MYAYHIWRLWYIGSYNIMAKPIKRLELHYSMIQFFIIIINVHVEKEMSSKYSSQKLCIILAEPYFDLYFFFVG